MDIIKINNITKDYGEGRGIFDVSFSVKEGEIMGFLGPNGAGKTTTIRHLLGFINPEKGNATIKDMNCFKNSDIISKDLAYLPGEISFFDNMTGDEFIDFIAKMKGMTDMSYAKLYKSKFELDANIMIKKMSKGMKQKLGLIVALMQNANILVLDEPTSGLDPLMQNRFIEIILDLKKKGKTILMSSHLFEEIEKTCDRVAIIKKGKIVAVEDVEKLRHNKEKNYEIEFENLEVCQKFVKENPELDAKINNKTVIISYSNDINKLLNLISKYKINDLNIYQKTLEELFMHFYGGEQND